MEKKAENAACGQKNPGIELLRIAAIFYVVLYYFLTTGGITENLQSGSVSYNVTWLIQIWVYCAIDIFGLISGYVNFREKVHAPGKGRIAVYLPEVLFFSIAGLLVSRVFSAAPVEQNELPIYLISEKYFRAYWFFLVFLLFSLFRPFLDNGLRSLDTGQFALLLPVFYVVSFVADRFLMSFLKYEGFSLVWLVFLYTAGAFLKKVQSERRFSIPKLFCIFLGLAGITWLWKIFAPKISLSGMIIHGDLLLDYLSPTVLGMAVVHVLLFSKIPISGRLKKVVLTVSSSVFGAYLLLVHPLFIKNVLNGRFVSLAEKSLSAMLSITILNASAFLILALLIDKFRQYFFRKLRVGESLHELFYGPDRAAALKKLVTPAYSFCFILAMCVLLWKCPYGYGNTDETAYLAIPYRIYKWRDGLLGQEWYQIQLFSFLMLPLYWIYDLLHAGMEGIVLNFRYIFTILWGCSALFFYFRLRRFSNPGAAAASLVFLLYTPFGIMAFSYNTLGIMLLLNACVIASTAVHRKKLQYFVSGVFFAGAVLCCPFLAALFVVYTAGVFVICWKKHDSALAQYWMFFILGILLMFVLFASFVLSRTGLDDILQNLPFILDDPGHGSLAFLHKMSVYFISLLKSTEMALYLWAAFIFMFAFSLIFPKAKGYCYAAVCVLSMIYIAELGKLSWINYVMFPAFLPGLFIAVHSKDAVVWRLFYWILLPGIIFTFCLNYSSDQELYAISSAASAASFAGLIIMALAPELSGLFENRFMKRFAAVLFCALFTVQIVCEQVLRINEVFWEKGMEDQIVYAEKGPEKGIRMTEEKLELYNYWLDEMEPIRNDESIRQILFLKNDSLLYLITQKEVASFSPYFPDVSPHTVSKLDQYFVRNPQKKPDAVFIPAEYSEFIPHYEEMGYVTSETSGGNYLLRKR